MAVVDDLEGDLVPALDLEGEAIVAERRQEAAGAGEDSGAGESGGFDVTPQTSIAGVCTHIVPIRREKAPKVGE
jgi:hypothetical protein